MLKKFIYICIASFFITLPTLAGVFEDAVKSNQYVLLYLYSSSCKFCVKFEPIYHNLAGIYGNKCKFLKVNAATPYGQKLMTDFGAGYVPYVVMRNNKNGDLVQIEPMCLSERACVEREIKHFINLK